MTSIHWEKDADRDFLDKDWTFKTYISRTKKNTHKEQENCPHRNYYVKCSNCGKLLGSELVMQHHLKKKNKRHWKTI